MLLNCIRKQNEMINNIISKPSSSPSKSNNVNVTSNEAVDNSCNIENENINITQLPSHVNNTNVSVSIINDESETQKTVKKRKRRTKKEIERDMLMQELKLKLSENNKNRVDDSVKSTDENTLNTNEIELDLE